MADEIPPEILTEIPRLARSEWPGDREMQQYTIDAETEAYRGLEDLDFGAALEHKPAILKEAREFHETWEEIFGFVSGEVEAFNTLATLAPEDVPADFVAEHKRKAAAEYDWFSSQLEDVEQAIEGYRYVQRTRAKVGPIRDILVRMEAIIGSECYNANIQNYSAWGVWETGEEAAAIPFLKRFTVFNVAQCENLPDELSAPPPPVPEGLIVPEAEALLRASGADLRLGGDKAFYAPGPDYIQIPRPEAYFEPINWHRTALHELGHWSGHPSRLARDLSGGFGSKAYAREELVAEMTSAFCCASLGIVPTVRHADYIGAWLEVLREDNRAIVRAASAASKAADYLLAFAPGAAASVEQNRAAA